MTFGFRTLGTMLLALTLLAGTAAIAAQPVKAEGAGKLFITPRAAGL